MYRIYIFGMVCLRCKRSADQDSHRQYSNRVHRDSFDTGSFNQGVYACSCSVHRLYLLRMVCLRLKRSADQDSHQQNTRRMHRRAFDCSKVDQGMHTDNSAN